MLLRALHKEATEFLRACHIKGTCLEVDIGNQNANLSLLFVRFERREEESAKMLVKLIKENDLCREI